MRGLGRMFMPSPRSGGLATVHTTRRTDEEGTGSDEPLPRKSSATGMPLSIAT